MSGVIDERGQQWERCCGCLGWKRIEDLGYVQPSVHHPYGIDLCVECVDTSIQLEMVPFEAIVPSVNWVVTEEE